MPFLFVWKESNPLIFFFSWLGHYTKKMLFIMALIGSLASVCHSMIPASHCCQPSLAHRQICGWLLFSLMTYISNQSSLIDSTFLISLKFIHFSLSHLTGLHFNHYHLSPETNDLGAHTVPQRSPMLLFTSNPFSTVQPEWSSWSANCIM